MNEKILIVDDEPQIHTVLGKMLNKEGYQVESAYSGEQALDLVSKSPPDLILLDIMMPKVSGIEVLKELKANPNTQNIRVLILSARDAQTDRLEGLAKGADDYIPKPFHLRSLVRKIQHILSKRGI